MFKKKIFMIIAAIIVLGVAAVILFMKPSDKHVFSPETVSPETGDISTSVTATGTIEPITVVDVGTQVSGIISNIYVDYNSVVKKGQILAELDKTTLQSELTSKELELKSSKTEYEYQKKNFNRSKELFGKSLISTTDYETAEYTFEKAEANYNKLVSDLVKTRTNLGYATIYSPIDGVVLSRSVEEGQTVAASFSTPTLFTIANDLTKMRVIANVDEADIGEVREGQRVSFTVDAYPNDVFEGEVSQVRLEATITSNVVTYEVVVNAPNPTLKLKPGLTANITIFTLEKNDILTLPNKAFNFKPDMALLKANNITIQMPSGPPSENSKTVWIYKNSTLTPRAVTTGATDGIHTEISAGLTTGDQVVTGINMASAQENTTGPAMESSPFMPKRPGSDRENGKKQP